MKPGIPMFPPPAAPPEGPPHDPRAREGGGSGHLGLAQRAVDALAGVRFRRNYRKILFSNAEQVGIVSKFQMVRYPTLAARLDHLRVYRLK